MEKFYTTGSFLYSPYRKCQFTLHPAAQQAFLQTTDEVDSYLNGVPRVNSERGGGGGVGRRRSSYTRINAWPLKLLVSGFRGDD